MHKKNFLILLIIPYATEINIVTAPLFDRIIANLYAVDVLCMLMYTPVIHMECSATHYFYSFTSDDSLELSAEGITGRVLLIFTGVISILIWVAIFTAAAWRQFG